jgi:hypothetical protein
LVFIELLQKFIILRPDPDNILLDDYLAELKLLNDQIDTTKIEFTADRCLLLTLILGLASYDQLKSLVQVWHATPNITGEKAIAILRTEVKRIKEDYEENQQAIDQRGRSILFGSNHCTLSSGRSSFSRHCNKYCW